MAFGVTAALLCLWAAIDSAPAQLGWCYLAFAALACAVNRRVLGGGWFSWVNVYLGISTLAIAGYPAFVSVGIVPAESFMPMLGSPGTRSAVAVAGIAIFAIEAGALSTRIFSGRNDIPPQRGTVTAPPLRRLGLVLTVGSALLIVDLLHTIGGIGVLSGGHYTQYMATLTQTSPIAGTLGIDYFPIGLTTYYLGLLLNGARDRNFERRQRAVLAAFLAFAGLLFLIGDRSTPLLAGVALLYVHHHYYRPIRLRMIALTTCVGLVALVGIGVLRNSGVTNRTNTGIVHSALDPVIGTFRPYTEFVDLWSGPPTGSQPRLGLAPYRSAAIHVLPFADRFVKQGTYVRSSILVTDLTSPIDASLNIFQGGSNTGEGYAAFGKWGVAFTSLVMGFGITAIERRARQFRPVALVILSLTFSASLFYIRDDVFSFTRNVLWGLALAALVASYLALASRFHPGAMPLGDRRRPPKTYPSMSS